MQHCTPVDQTSSHAAAEPSTTCAAPKACFLSAHAYCCEFDDGAIILDLHNDAYLGIDAQHLSYLRDCIENWPHSQGADREPPRHGIAASEGLIANLITRGVLTNSPPSRQSSSLANPTVALTVGVYAERRNRIAIVDTARFSVAFLAVLLRLRLSGLASLLDWLRRRQSSIQRGHSVTTENVRRRLASFLWLRAWCYTSYRRCLFDSLVLSVYLTKASVPCTFVVGVVTKPFLAHAWVQIGNVVLNDTAEHVQDFKPILSVSGE
jgi:Transglutaminase-like superfamily